MENTQKSMCSHDTSDHQIAIISCFALLAETSGGSRQPEVSLLFVPGMWCSEKNAVVSAVIFSDGGDCIERSM